MTAGLPGIGIGGIFYLICALIMPLIEVVLTIQGKSNAERWLLVGRQFGFLCLILAGFWVTGELIRVLINTVSLVMAATHSATHHLRMPAMNIFRIQPLFLSLATLCGVMLSMQIMNLVYHLRLKK